MSSQIDFFSTTRQPEGSKRCLDADLISDMATKASRVTVISSFFDFEFFRESFGKNCPRTIEIFVNDFAGARGQREQEVLRNIEKFLKRKKANVRIGMLRETGLFHSKIFCFERKGKSTRYLTGSCNATSAALHRNEEIMMMFEDRSPGRQVDRYVEDIRRDALPLGTKPDRIHHDIVSLMMDGSVWAKPNLTRSFFFNPRFSPTLVKALKSSHSIDGLEAKGGTVYSLMQGLDTNASPAGDRVAIGRMGVSTSLGIWMPSVYQQEAEDRLNSSAGLSRKKIERLRRAALRSARSGEMLRKACASMRKAERVSKSLPRSDWRFTDGLRRGLEKHIDQCVQKISNPAWIDRLAHGWVPYMMPILSDDIDCLDEFRDTFCDSLAFESATRRNHYSLVYSAFLQRISELKEAVSAQDVLDCLSKHVETEGWDDTVDWRVKNRFPKAK